MPVLWTGGDLLKQFVPIPKRPKGVTQEEWSTVIGFAFILVFIILFVMWAIDVLVLGGAILWLN